MARVLVIDSDEDFRESTRLVLERAGHDAYAHGDVRAALPLMAAGWRVIIEHEVAPLIERVAPSGTRVIAVEKPIHPMWLLAAVDRP